MAIEKNRRKSMFEVPRTLDHIKPIQMTLSTGIDGSLNVRGGLNLKDGLKFLAEKMRTFELEACSEIGINFAQVKKKDKFFDPLISCIFHWYSTSLLNYLRFIAMIEYSELNELSIEQLHKSEHGQQIKLACDCYVDNLVPEVKFWRNKISAHFAATDVRNDDVDMIKTSLHGYPELVFGHFTMRPLPSDSIVMRDMEWSVTKVHEKLAPRLWPEHKLASLTH